ncbi:uroporphyrinogen-III synthase [Staphylococcus chromogenes]|uniref:uroporphyrinogen-III synthase n=1 Tax=Staphylococcus chromogenes TaxID=46126 RepID=UPI000D19C131|nr:uroporphyrinogen-III synthase [Staphylococcus chromogenes]MDT0700123.1 uroporphyrinogen-III synthase [Staphylococcus chromogenes]MDU0450443.1 uroporphyrinogen-III synthase [Staphylococcus chromogenes]PTF69442.1 uroporphyrinogen III synthase [Staphylococcus chromogenes]PTF73674.1 uroporphyrinogen III synthase [Staphylococcus chromogenes]PTG10434.1 uroporphyrinogen III synthase [Staphylococcus chromogenes]
MKPIVLMTQTHEYQDQRVAIKHVPLIETIALDFDDKALCPHYDWLIFTSKNAVKYFYPYLKLIKYNQIAVVGVKTKQLCDKMKIDVDFCPTDFSQEGLFNQHPFKKGDRVLIPSSRQARTFLQNALKESGIQVTKIDLYEVQPKNEAIQKILDTMMHRQVDAITFASSSAARAFFEAKPPHNENIYFAIGQQTAQTIRKLGYSCFVAEVQTLESMITKIVEKRSYNDGI